MADERDQSSTKRGFTVLWPTSALSLRFSPTLPPPAIPLLSSSPSRVASLKPYNYAFAISLSAGGVALVALVIVVAWSCWRCRVCWSPARLPPSLSSFYPPIPFPHAHCPSVLPSWLSHSTGAQPHTLPHSKPITLLFLSGRTAFTCGTAQCRISITLY